jgi:crotonobetainyl-CoA:carnitine CoA-transferase CaiB-like acyl-CoA transferase
MEILFALQWRNRSGEGRYLDISMCDGVVPLFTLPFDMMKLGQAYRPGESIVGGGLACYNFYRTRDHRYLAVGALEAKFFEKLCIALGIPDMVPLQFDAASQTAVKSRLAGVFAQKTADEWDAMLGPMNICVTRVNTFDEAMAVRKPP